MDCKESRVGKGKKKNGKEKGAKKGANEPTGRYVTFTFQGETLALEPADARAYADDLIVAAQQLVLAADEIEALTASGEDSTDG